MHPHGIWIIVLTFATFKVPATPVPQTLTFPLFPTIGDISEDQWTLGVQGYTGIPDVDHVTDKQAKQKNYARLCTCKANGKIKGGLGKRACSYLNDVWPNLIWDSNLRACKDVKKVGLVPMGYEAACQKVSQYPGSPFESTPWEPVAVRGKCAWFKPNN